MLCEMRSREVANCERKGPLVRPSQMIVKNILSDSIAFTHTTLSQEIDQNKAERTHNVFVFIPQQYCTCPYMTFTGAWFLHAIITSSPQHQASSAALRASIQVHCIRTTKSVLHSFKLRIACCMPLKAA